MKLPHHLLAPSDEVAVGDGTVVNDSPGDCQSRAGPSRSETLAKIYDF